jgi:type IV pilus assembly protein PilY1
VDYAKKSGWYLDLLGTDQSGSPILGERVVSPSVFHDGRITFASFVPNSKACESGGQGWIMELDAITGSRLMASLPIFDINNDNQLNAADDLVLLNGALSGSPSGILVEGVPSATHIMRDSDYVYRINSMSSGEIKVLKGRADPNANSRVSWRQAR